MAIHAPGSPETEIADLHNIMSAQADGHNGHHRPARLDVKAIRRHFLFPEARRTVTNNAATTQVPVDLLRLQLRLARDYENVHRGQSRASLKMTRLLEEAYDTVAGFLNAPGGRKSIVLFRNTTEAINAVMYTLLTEFRDGDNVVTTMMEHNSNYVPWYALCHEILPRFGVQVECRLVGFKRETGELDLEQLSYMVDSRTKLVGVTGASNFLGTKNPLPRIREMAHGSGYYQPSGRRGSYLLVDGAQLVPGTPVDMAALGADFLAFSLHKMLAPFGVGVLYAREEVLRDLPPFLYGGDMIAQGQVTPQKVGYNALPWKYVAGTPNILGDIVSAQALRLLLDLVVDPHHYTYFATGRPFAPGTVRWAMGQVNAYLEELTAAALARLERVPGLTIYGPHEAAARASLVAFNVTGLDPMELAEKLAEYGVEARAGCHCATLAHHYLGLDPPASCRLSFYIYNTPQDVTRAVDALTRIVTRRTLVPAPVRKP